MDIYVESRTKHVDYYWVNRSTAPEKVHNVPRIIQSVTKFNEDKDLKLIHESDPSIVLLRSQGELLLFVSGLQTKRQDKDRRYIRNSIAWVGEKTDEPILRSLAALVLENNLQILENLVVESSNSSGELFEVNWQAIEQLIPPNVGDTMTLPEQNKNGKIARTSELRTQELANELRQYNLPVGDGAIVAVTTGFKPTAIFARANVWRGLSNDPEASNEWVVLKPSTPVNLPPPNRKILRLVILAGTLIILAVSAYLVYTNPISPGVSNSNRNPQTDTTESPGVSNYTPNPQTGITTVLCPNRKSKLPQLLSNEKKYEEIVEQLQFILNNLPPEFKVTGQNPISSDGNFNTATMNAVKDFQKKYYALTKSTSKITGHVDTDTWTALWEKTQNEPQLSENWENICNSQIK